MGVLLMPKEPFSEQFFKEPFLLSVQNIWLIWIMFYHYKNLYAM